MPAFDVWEDERERLLDAADESERDRLAHLLDRAKSAATAGKLREAAVVLGEARRIMVGNNLFRSWDEGIWCFSSLIRVVRHLSPEESPPLEYQRLLDVIPDERIGVDMTPDQKRFWYGSPGAVVGGELRAVPTGAADKSGCLVVLPMLGPVLRSLLRP